MGNSISQNEDEHKGKKVFVGIRQSLCPTQKISCSIQFNNMKHYIKNMVRCTENKEDGREKITSAKGQYFKLYRRLFYLFMRCFMAIVFYFGVVSFAFLSGHYLVRLVHFFYPQNIRPQERSFHSAQHRYNSTRTLIFIDLLQYCLE